MTHTALFILYLVEHLSGVLIITYRTRALENGWPMGTMYGEPGGASPVKLLGMAAILHSTFGSLVQLGWGYSVGLVAIGFLFNAPISRMAGPPAQVACPIAALACAAVVLFS